jgi:hypothetical protein
MRWVGHAAHMRAMRNAYRYLLGSLNGRDHSKNIGVDVRIILKSVLRKQSVTVWT